MLGRLGDELDAPTARFDATVVASCHEAVESLAGALGGLDAVIVVPGFAAFGSATELEPELVEQCSTSTCSPRSP